MFLVVLTTLLAILAIPLVWWYVTLAKFSSMRKVPGPQPLPIVGNAKDVGTTTVGLLRSFLKLNREYGGMTKVWLGPRLHLLLTDPKVIEEVLGSTVHLEKTSGYELFRPWLGDGLLLATGAKWRSRRKMITPTFHFRILEKFLETFNRHIDTLVDILSEEVGEGAAGKSIEVHNFHSLCSLDIICETAFGTSINAQFRSNNDFVEAVNGTLEVITLRFFSAWLRYPWVFRFSGIFRAYEEHLRILHDFTGRVILQRREEFRLLQQGIESVNELGIKKRAALLDMLLEVSEDGKVLSDDDIRDEVNTFMFEGYDTTASAVSFTLYAIAENPEVQARVYDELISVLGPDYKREIKFNELQELKYFDIVIKEALRMYPPVPLIERRLENDITIDGVTIPKETNISIFIYGMMHSPEVFPDPANFDPGRFLPEAQDARNNFAYVPFSAGSRNCIGQKFALLELKATLAKLLRRFEFAPDPSKPIEVGMCSVLKSSTGVHLKMKLRKPKSQ